MIQSNTPTQIFLKDLAQIRAENPELRILADADANNTEYEKRRRLFNKRFSYRPAAIFMCKTPDDVKVAIRIAEKYDLPLRAKSGGHDHEGESCATDCILINLQEMRGFERETLLIEGKETDVVRVGPGWKFKDIVGQHLDPNRISIPHGTCGTVNIGGFTLGGGWGPWTRRHGMCCDRLVGAKVVIGTTKAEQQSGLPKWKEVELSLNDQEKWKKDLLWALRGGGGFSFGIVTEYVLHCFDQPTNTRKFQVIFNRQEEFNRIPKEGVPALKVLKRWEHLIDYDQNENLLGTNLQIMGIPYEEKVSAQTSIHKCVFWGYLDGTSQDVIETVGKWFHDFKKYHLVIEQSFTEGEYQLRDGTTVTASPENPVMLFENADYQFSERVKYEQHYEQVNTTYSFGNWHRVTQETKRQQHPLLRSNNQNDTHPILKLIPPDADQPAPHRITSRMVQEDGLGEEGRINLINSLRSKVITQETYNAGLMQYVTLGSISGSYYRKYKENAGLEYKSSFPYHLRPYIIQYQVWWNTDDATRSAGKTNHVRLLSNIALDWIDKSRTRNFPQVEGSFISFKDASVPTEDYFLENYQRLVQIKKDVVGDENNLFQSRKTIL